MPAVLLILWPFLEIASIVEVATRIGVGWTLILLIAGFAFGVQLLRTLGASHLRRVSQALAQGHGVGDEAADGALVLLAGFLLIIPGFVSDVVALLLLLPPVRRYARRNSGALLRRSPVARAVRFSAGRVAPEPYDVDSTAIDLDQPRLRR